ncbi:MAG: hypothetical protein AB7S69_17495 [Salinivirgaceae bacterium]
MSYQELGFFEGKDRQSRGGSGGWGGFDSGGRISYWWAGWKTGNQDFDPGISYSVNGELQGYISRSHASEFISALAMGMALENEFRNREERQHQIDNSIAGSGLSYTRDPSEVIFGELANSGGGDINPFSAYWHYKFGRGTDYHVDISQIDWSMLSEKNFPGGIGSLAQINIFGIKPLSTAGLVFGDILLQYLGNNQIKVADFFVDGPNKGKPYFDTFNYNVRWGELLEGENVGRNIATGFGWMGTNMPWSPMDFNTYGGNFYKIWFHGIGIIGGGQ